MKYLTLLLALLASLQAQPSLVNGDGGGISNPAFRNAVLPAQVSQAGKYLKTDGTSATWETVTSNLTSGPVTSSGGVSAIADGALSIAKTSGLQTALDARRNKTTERIFLPEDYGALGDGIELTGNVTITTGTAALTVSTAAFVAGDVGKYILVPGAGTAGGILVSTIATRVSATQVTLANNASTTLTASSKSVHYCTNDSAALQATINAAQVSGGTVILSKSYGIATQLLITKGWVKITGTTNGNSFPEDYLQPQAQSKCGLHLLTANMIGLYVTGTAGESCQGLTFRDFTVQGDYDLAYNFQGKRGLVAYIGGTGAKYPDCLLIDRVNFQWLNECIYLEACDSPTITNSRVCDSYKGISLVGCIGGMISHNVIWDDIIYGVSVTSTNNYGTTITGNAMGRSGRDIVFNGDSLTITGNTFTSGWPSPIAAQYSAIQCTGNVAGFATNISGNTFSSPGYGTGAIASTVVQGWRTAAIDLLNAKSVSVLANNFNFISTTLPAVKITGGDGVAVSSNNFTTATKLPIFADATSRLTRITDNTHEGTITNLGTVPIGTPDSDEVVAYVARLATYGVTVTSAQQTLLNNFVTAEKATTNRWAKHKRIFITGWGDAKANAVDLKTGKSGNYFGTMTHTLSRVYTAAISDICTLAAHGFVSGDAVRVTTTNTIPAGLAINTTYYVVNLTSSTFSLAATYANAIAGTPVVDITSTGTGGANSIYKVYPGFAYGDGSTGFLDMGCSAYSLRTEAPLSLTGVVTGGVNGNLLWAGVQGGYPAWSTDGTTVASATNTIVSCDATTWTVSRGIGGSVYLATKAATFATQVDPNGLSGWTITTGSGDPVCGVTFMRDQSVGALVFSPHTVTSALAGVICGGSTQLTTVQLLDTGTGNNLSWYASNGTAGPSRPDTGGFYLGTRSNTAAKLWRFTNGAVNTSATATLSTSNLGGLDDSMICGWRRATTDYYSDAKIGVLYIGGHLDDSDSAAFGAAMETLWEGLFGLTLP